MSIKKLSAHHD